MYRPKAHPYGPESTNQCCTQSLAPPTASSTTGAKATAGGAHTQPSSSLRRPRARAYRHAAEYPNDPALFYSGSGQMELAATSGNGDLVYAHWRDEMWGNFKIIGPHTATRRPFATGATAVIASAPGQAEIIVVGSDGNSGTCAA